MAEPLRSNSGAGDKGNKDRQRQLNTLIGLSERFGEYLSNAFAKNISEGA
ncbi:hypothetical protein [Microvirga sp. BSC39]|nr:hypothetical protein [Microvirga sp. BSC39]